MAVCFQLFVLLSFTIFVVLSDILDRRFFLGQILEKYGNNGTISYEGFERLYSNLGLGGSNAESRSRPENELTSPSTHIRANRQIKYYNSTNEYPLEEEIVRLVSQHDEVVVAPGYTRLEPLSGACLSARELLVIYGATDSLSPVSFLHLCPAIVYELDQRTCLHQANREHDHVTSGDNSSTSSNWLFGILSIVVISLSGVLCVLTVQFLQKTLVNQLISFLVALAVGTLLGDALLHLIPHALETHGTNDGKSHTDAAMKTGVMFLTIVFFFSFEAVLNIIQTRKEELELKDDNNYVTVRLDKSDREMIDVNVVHGHGHSHSDSGSNNTAVMVVMGDGLHNLTDGLAIGAAFTGGLAPGFATAVAVFTHELPHELGDFAVLLQAGIPVRRAVLFNLLSSVLSLIGCVLGLFIGNFGDTTRWVYAVTAGCFIYIALSNLVPAINKEKSSWRAAVLRLCGILCGGSLMGCIVLLEDDIQHLFT